MQQGIRLLPKAAIFLAGVAAGAITLQRRPKGTEEAADTRELKEALAKLESRVAAQEAASSSRVTQIEARLDEHAHKLAEIPSTAQIVEAMEQLLRKTMSSLDERLTTQAQSIDVLKATVSQTDNLLERVLESLDSLQSHSETAELNADPVLHRSA
jgi:chromosome segregation ATPase